MNSRAVSFLSASLLALAILTPPAPAQTLEVGLGVDPGARTTRIEFKVVGAPGASVALFGALALAPTPLVLPFGTLRLDPATLVPIATFALNAAGVGSVGFTLPAAAYRSYAFDVQAAVVSGGTLTLTPYAMVGGYANSPGTEILAASYHPVADHFWIHGKGPSGALLEVFRKPPLAPRLRLAGITVPYAMMALGVAPCLFVPGESLDVVVFGTTGILSLR
ncbi:MAG: hypothetical protein IT458_04625 [Planctomycetes bacterium]|nr:hypothetical protein [Planctomycetota bacterium]